MNKTFKIIFNVVCYSFLTYVLFSSMQHYINNEELFTHGALAGMSLYALLISLADDIINKIKSRKTEKTDI